MRMHLRHCIGAVAVILTLAGSAVCMARTPTVGDRWADCAYVLGEYSGCVAVFEPERSALPSRVTDIRVQLLPEADRLQLHDGIPVQTRRELLMLLEDFNS